MLSLFFLLIVILSACGGSPATSSTSNKPNVTITLEAPNQWNDSGTSFGTAWDTAIAQYHKLNPNVTVKIVVLPLSSFFQTTSTQLAAGTAPDIVFNQATYKPYMVVQLDSYLNKPNPYAPERPHWIDWFNKNAFSSKISADANGNLDWVPLNLFDAGLFYNKDAFAKAGVEAPIKTWEDWRVASQKLKAAGYAPLAMDNSTIGLFWTWQSILNPLLAKYYDQWNVYDVKGNAGKNDTLTNKDYARAIKLGLLTPKLPEFVEALQLMKETFTQDVTPNWSGIKGNSGAGANLPDFLAGRAAMAWGANFGAGDVKKASFQSGSMPWPQITDATTPLSQNFPSQFGVAAGGTSYMIPATTKGDQLKYAVDFLQFMTAPKYSQPWITDTTAVPSVETVQAPDVIAAFSTGDWGMAPRQSALNTAQLTGSLIQDFTQIIQGYILGTANLATTQDALEAAWQRSVTQALKDNPQWKTEDWASK